MRKNDCPEKGRRRREKIDYFINFCWREKREVLIFFLIFSR
jgi:hypothetical protein